MVENGRMGKGERHIIGVSEENKIPGLVNNEQHSDASTVIIEIKRNKIFILTISAILRNLLLGNGDVGKIYMKRHPARNKSLTLSCDAGCSIAHGHIGATNIVQNTFTIGEIRTGPWDLSTYWQSLDQV